MTFTGSDVREVRKKHRLSRAEMAGYLEVSPVTIEKWEQQGDKPIRPKYLKKLSALGGMGAAGLAVGTLLAPAILGPALLAGGVAGAGLCLSDDDLDRASELLEGLKRLSPEERETLFSLSKKMRGEH